MNLVAGSIRVTRERLLPLFVLAALAVTTPFARLAWTAATHGVSWQNTAPIDISKELRYRLLVENSQARIFTLTIPPGQQSFVRHEHNFLTVTLADSEVIMWTGDESPIRHFRAPPGEIHFLVGKSAHGIRNESKVDYRNITVEFLDPHVANYGYRYESGKWDFGPSVLNLPVDPEGHFVNSLDLERAVAKDVQLLPKETLPATKGPQLLIALTTLDLSAGADRKISLSPGEVMWRETGDPGLTNKGPARTRFAVVEFKPANGRY